MAAPLVLRQVLLLRVCLHSHKRLTAGAVAVAARHRLWCIAATNTPSNQADEKISSSLRRVKEPSSYPRWEDDPDYRKWKDKEDEILGDIEPIVLLTKDILHSRRYLDGERLTVEDEKAVVEKLLAYHPHSEDKIGCGLESIMIVFGALTRRTMMRTNICNMA
ncbi:protein DCL, chloroplastic-like isoform X2 [Gastrolobium bilobum]|uniref:protein DCL, chloroplastic-like isoform X2 n=1 Tax=Gastrolobium bilobum TaxID=150636 RepID=UPI002AAF46CD|nr:protein DCL, chloroplastic-like isoform X2 [Gastrolobium bilobum]